MLLRRSLSVVLVSQLVLGSIAPTVQAAQTSAPKASFVSILKNHRAELEKSGADHGDVMNRFAKELIDQNVGVDEVSGFVKTQLSSKEFKAYQKYMDTALMGLDPNQLSTEEFSQIVEQALKVTQAKGLTWSSCTTMTGGIVLGAASLIVGIIALAKAKIDFQAKKLITPQDLQKTRDGEISSIKSTYSTKTTILRDPQAYYDGKIQSSYVQMGLNNQSIQDYQLRRADAETRRSNLEYAYSQAVTENDRYYYSNEIDKVESQIRSYNDSISSLQYSNQTLLSNISKYQSRKIYYSDPAVIAAEKAELEVWYPQALATAEDKFQVSLANLDKTNDLIREDNEARRLEIEEKNVDIAKTKKTLGIIAGIGGAASLAALLTSVSSCQKSRYGW
ncbi:MAG: hypothetical protein JNL01_16705 [Bdellovibrionales bacterium]|nr:hypothetical protein [Bdellovibrionales bacterium]